MAACPALLVSAPASNQGKTLVTAALARAWTRQGLRVRAFKCGPDFLDGMILQAATGHPVYNIDLTMCGEDDARTRLHQAALEADVILLEGVMGLYDGSLSSADIAERLGIPLALVVDASGMAQTFGALVAGLASQRPQMQLAGAIANRVGSAHHAQLLRDSLPDSASWLGALPKHEAYSLPERHLGLYTAAEIDGLEAKIEAASRALAGEHGVPLPPIVAFPPTQTTPPARLLEGKTIAIARDAAFCFIYQANIECLLAMGAQLQFFSLLHDQSLPQADALWLPGGYPELHLQTISTNTGMRAALRQVVLDEKPILAECGGMMALSQHIDGYDSYQLLPGQVEMTPKLKGLGIQTVTLPEGELRAHTFHYSQFHTELAPLTHAINQRGKQGEAVYRHGRISASYLHYYFPSNPAAIAALLS